MTIHPAPDPGLLPGQDEHAAAVVFDAPGTLALRELTLKRPGPEDLIVAVRWTGISTGTERLLYRGEMPPFPGLAYPLVPGYEAVGDVVWAGRDAGVGPGARVFVPGASCFEDARCLFGATASRLVVPGARVVPVPEHLGVRAVLLALAATAQHALVDDLSRGRAPGLIIGHGVLGRLLARLCVASGTGTPPTVWETSEQRMSGARGYRVIRPDADPRTDYDLVVDASGDSAILNELFRRLTHRGEVVLTGFYAKPLSFDFPPAFQREARLRIAAEWSPDDMAAVASLVTAGRLSLADLISHTRPSREAALAYPQAFDDPSCLKLVLDWSAP